MLATCEQGKGVRIWDLALGRDSLIDGPLTSWIAPVFSPDGRLMAVNCRDGTAVLRERSGGRERVNVRGLAAGFTPDSRALATFGADGVTLRLVDSETGRELWKSDLTAGSVRASLAYSPDGQTMIVARGGVLRFFDVKSGRERWGESESHQGGVNFVRYTDDGRSLLTAADDGTVRQWDSATASPKKVMRYAGRVAVCAVSADGTALAAFADGPDGGLSVRDLATGAVRRQWPGTGQVAGALAFSLDNTALRTFDHENGMRIFDIMTGGGARRRATEIQRRRWRDPEFMEERGVFFAR